MDRAILTVANQGEPIRAEALPTLFDPFRRATTRAHAKGLGLGLHIVYEIVKAHCGTVAVRSNERDGTVFTVSLPNTPPEQRPA